MQLILYPPTSPSPYGNVTTKHNAQIPPIRLFDFPHSFPSLVLPVQSYRLWKAKAWSAFRFIHLSVFATMDQRDEGIDSGLPPPPPTSDRLIVCLSLKRKDSSSLVNFFSSVHFFYFLWISLLNGYKCLHWLSRFEAFGSEDGLFVCRLPILPVDQISLIDGV